MKAIEARLHLLKHQLDRKRARFRELGERLPAALAARGEAEEGTALWIVRDRAVSEITNNLLSVTEELRWMELEVFEVSERMAPPHPNARDNTTIRQDRADQWMLKRAAKENQKLKQSTLLFRACMAETGATWRESLAAHRNLPEELRFKQGNASRR